MQDLQNSAKAGCLLVRVGAGYQSGLLQNSAKVPPRACGCGQPGVKGCQNSDNLIERVDTSFAFAEFCKSILSIYRAREGGVLFHRIL